MIKRIGKTKILSFGITQETTKHIEGLKEKLKIQVQIKRY